MFRVPMGQLASSRLKFGPRTVDTRITMPPSSERPFELRFDGSVPTTLSGWADQFIPGSLPVLRGSACAIEELRANEDAVDAHLLSEALSQDPLMVVKVMAHVANMRRHREGTDPETLTAALVMLGITPFFRAFGPQLDVEQLLGGFPEALEGFQAVLRRSHRAARFALCFAVQRMDHDAAVLHEAALLHDFVELLMWLRAPELSADVARRQRADPALRTADAQMAVFNIRLPELQHVLMLKWRLPRLLVDVTDDTLEAISVQARSVVLAIRLARHTARDWNNPAIADDIRDVGNLLNLSPQHAEALVRDIDEAESQGP